MSQILRLQVTVVLPGAFTSKCSRLLGCGYGCSGWRTWEQNVLGRTFGNGTCLLSKESTKVKATLAHPVKKKWRKKKSSLYKNKVEAKLFKLLNARTTQLASEALRRGEGETHNDWSKYAIFVVPDTPKFSFTVAPHDLMSSVGHQSLPKKRTNDYLEWSENTTLFISQFSSSETESSSHKNVLNQEACSVNTCDNLDDLKRNVKLVSRPDQTTDWQDSVSVFQNQFRTKGISDTLEGKSCDTLQNVHEQNNSSVSSLSYLDSSLNNTSSVSVAHTDNIGHFVESREGAVDDSVENLAEYSSHLRSNMELDSYEIMPIPLEQVDDILLKPFPQPKEAAVEETTTKSKSLEGKTQKQSKRKPWVLSPTASVENEIELFNKVLLPYVEACCYAGMLKKAHSVIKFYHRNKNMKKIPSKIQDINIFNTLMREWAKKGKFDRVQELFSILREDGLKPTLQTYAACLECVHRQGFDLELCQGILRDLKNDGLDVQEIFVECNFKKDERQVIEQVLRRTLKDFRPEPEPDSTYYVGPLVENLNVAKEDLEKTKNPFSGVVTANDLNVLLQTQMERELHGTVRVESIMKKETISKETEDYREKLDMVKKEWKEMLTRGIQRRFRYLTRQNKGEHGHSLLPYLQMFSPVEYVDFMMLEVEKAAATMSGTYSPSKYFLCSQLGWRLYGKYLTGEKIRNGTIEKLRKIYKDYSEHYCEEQFPFSNHRDCWQSLIHKHSDGPSVDKSEKPWSYYVVLMIGKMLYDIILYDVKVDANIFKKTTERNMVPAFYTIYRSKVTKSFAEVKPNPIVVRLYEGAQLDYLTFNSPDMPMVVPPIPWVSSSHGSYFLNSVDLIRRPDQSSQHLTKMIKQPTSNMRAIVDSLNSLAACAWTINKPMLDLIIDIFKNNGMKELDIPPPVSTLPPLPKITSDMSNQQKAKIFDERQKLRQTIAEMYSLWCTELYRLSIANMFRDKKFWFPHNMDFRGRTYPCPPHFNHLGSDVARSIIQFAKGKPLGARGLDWLKIHLINLTGLKKRCSNAERLEFANQMLPEILDSADRPLEGGKWWQKSDEPWQTLTCCKEISTAVRSPDHTQYISHFPVHQDGSCNGLQHYAALGRDEVGGASVNLTPSDVPQDVYTDVVELVEEVRRKDAAAGNKIAQILEGFVKRKVIKQTVMTTVYGVTRHGARHQILRQLKDIPEFPEEHAWVASSYLTIKTFQCLQEMFTATKEIQDWLTLCAQLISSIGNSPVEWTTPLGLLCVQPYHLTQHLRRFGVDVTTSWNKLEKPNSMKQKNAFPPNFIHSLDSTHMMLTSLFCQRAGITFVSVHDCYWTHAADVEVMNRICREQFVSLHEQPILETLSQALVERFAQQTDTMDLTYDDANVSSRLLRSVLSAVPSRGNLDLKKILDSTYFFS